MSSVSINPVDYSTPAAPGAKTLTVAARFHGNRYLGATTNRFKVKVPAT